MALAVAEVFAQKDVLYTNAYVCVCVCVCVLICLYIQWLRRLRRSALLAVDMFYLLLTHALLAADTNARELA